MIYMLWRGCMPVEYCSFISEEKNFLYLNGKNVLWPKVLQIIAEFIEKDEKTLSYCKLILLGTRLFFSLSILTFTLRFTVLLKKEVSI